MSPPIKPFWKQPSHPGIIEVDVNPGSFASMTRACRKFNKNEIITKITGHTEADIKAYSTVQISENEHIELNSDLLYCNHSCDPNVIFDVSNYEVRAIKSIEIGDPITFFYPSSEWNMAQPFNCNCQSAACIGEISGASDLPKEVLKRYWLNKHITDLLEKREGNQNGF